MGIYFQNIEYHLSVTRLAPSDEAKDVKCGLCTQAVKRTLATMLDYSLMKSPSFLLIALNSSFLCLGFYTAYIFIKDTAIQAGVSEHTAFWLISIIGLANTTGRILLGVLANLSFMDFQLLTSGGVIIGGIATIIYAHTKNPILHIGYAVLYGLSVGKSIIKMYDFINLLWIYKISLVVIRCCLFILIRLHAKF